MNICVVGWYYNQELYKILSEVNKKHPVFIIDHRGSVIETNGIRITRTENIGLEFGAYDVFLKNLWDHSSPVLFMHDDTRILDPLVFDEIAALDCDQAYIFRDYVEEIANGRRHGRAIFCSKRFLVFMLKYRCECKEATGYQEPHNNVFIEGIGPHRGFWFDRVNDSHTRGRVPVGMHHYNTAIYHFAAFAGRCQRNDPPWPGFNTDIKYHNPKFICGKRGEWKGPIYGRETLSEL